ncbi:hypothetical protein FQZ97_774140 [compost metagenome]
MQAGGQGLGAKRLPVGVGCEVFGDHQFAAARGVATRAELEVRLQAVDGLPIRLGQARRGGQMQALLRIQQHDRHLHVRVELLQMPADVVENLRQGPTGEQIIE